MPKYDVTKLNVGVEKCLAVTTNPRHRFLLQAYSRHRLLEVAGRYEEIFAPAMMIEDPSYHFHASGINAKLEGKASIAHGRKPTKAYSTLRTSKSPSQTISSPLPGFSISRSRADH